MAVASQIRRIGSRLTLAGLVLTALISGPAETPAGDPARRLPAGAPAPLQLTADAPMAAADARVLTEYLINCALPEGVEVQAEHNGQDHRFAGAMGLAPSWIDKGLTLEEQRWVSACILARTNRFGKKIKLSLRAEESAFPALQASAQERALYSLFEGGFFGNIFAESPTAYVCGGKLTTRQAMDRIFNDRVCAEPSGETLISGARLTRCGFIYTGPCNDPSSLAPDSTAYREVIYTYLQPAGPKPDGAQDLKTPE